MSGKRILIVEDDADSANILEAYLRRDGFEVALAEDGRRGLDLHESWCPDLVLLDWELPGLSGRQLLRLLRFERPEIRVLVLSGRPEAEEAARAAGADAFVGKGDSTSHLLQVLQELRDSRDRGGEEDIYRGR